MTTTSYFIAPPAIKLKDSVCICSSSHALYHCVATSNGKPHVKQIQSTIIRYDGIPYN